MPIKQGAMVVAPDGRHGIVKRVNAYQTGKRGRPPLVATVQLLDKRSRKLTAKRVDYWSAELRVAS